MRMLRALDAGCGAGRVIGHLRSLDDAVTPTGLDLSPAMAPVGP
jgi:predicted TPR repeat methyltransferase